jgi:aminoglycoside phosphotransferase (APT) family kinase protein
MSAGWEAIHRIPFPTLTTEQLVAICDRHGLPRGPFGRLPSTGIINTIYTVGDDVLLRIPKNVPEGLRDTYTESVAVPVAVAAGVATPPLLSFDDDRDVVDVPFGVYERVHAPDGEPTAEGWRALGRDLARLHAVAPSAVADPHGRLDQPGRWCQVEQVLASLPHLDAEDRSLLAAALDRLEPAVQVWEATGRRCFLHNDVKDSNLLVREGDYVAIIDWGDAGWGDPTIDLRTLPPSAREWILSGYREIHELPDADTFGDRLRWDQIGAAARRLAEPLHRDRFRRLVR